jgi:HEAT repeat protein/putative sister chromatid cohesion protein
MSLGLKARSKRPLLAVGMFIVLFAALLVLGMTRIGRGSTTGPRPISKEIVLGQAHAGSLHGVTVSIKDPSQLQGQESIHIAISDAKGEVAEKWLHTADLDFYLTVRPRASGAVKLKLESTDILALPALTTAFQPVPEPRSGGANEPAVISAYPNGTWDTAQPIEFGQTIFASGDERPYAPAPVEDAYAAMLKGFQWFKFTFHGKEPCLAYFVLGITDRDVPLDVDVFQPAKAGQTGVVPYNEGEFVYQIEATQNYPGLYKFRTRILKPGETYYLRVAADHPAYQLRMYDYPVPPYKDPRLAVRAGMDFIVNMGDTWLSNTPRRGAVALRTTMVHAETHLCIACHPTQFSTRAYLTAIANGYPPVQRPSLEFLTDRIYNNSRPLYGVPGANWVRVIYSARTVASRLPLIENLFETNVSHDPPRPNFAVPYGNFLKVHYKGRTEMPGEETDGCEPMISPYEIATQSWQLFDQLGRQTHDSSWLAERDEVERLAPGYEPKNIIDVNWAINFFAVVGREKYSKQLDGLIQKLEQYQLPDGEWPYHFDKTEKPADFITYHAMYALACAGRRPETDPHLARAVEYCLSHERPEGSWEGDPVYQGFNTPFRATEFAVMGLSQLFSGPDTKPADKKRWDDAFAPPSTRKGKATGLLFPAWSDTSLPTTPLATDDLPRLLWQLDQFWDLAPLPLLRQIRQILATHPQPLAREAAARALGHMADPGAVSILIRALGDPSKLVQRSAAFALRQVLVRRSEVSESGKAELAAALRSPDARTRWGATRLFDQHFKYLTGDPRLLAALEVDLSDSVPAVRFQAAKGLWQWYYWQVDQPQVRAGILEALATHLNTEADTMVRRGLQESVYNVLDENTGYLGAWVRTAATKPDSQKIIDGYEAAVRDQAQTLSSVLRVATPQGREGILDALWDFHVRHYALPPLKANTVSIALPAVEVKYVSGVPDLHLPGYEYPPYREAVNFRYDVHNGFFQTRVGNDSDLIHFFKSSGPELEGALIACLTGADDDTKINVLKAGSTLSSAGGEKFAQAVLRLSLDPDASVRETVSYVYENGQRGILNINTPERPDPQLISTVVKILDEGTPESQAVLLPMLASLPVDSAWTSEPAVTSALKALLEKRPRPANYDSVLVAASSFPALAQEAGLRDLVLAGLNDPDPAVERASIQIVIERLLPAPETEPRVKEAFAALSSPARGILIEEVNDPKFARRHAGTSGGAISQDQSYFLGEDYSYKPPDFLASPIVRDTIVASLTDKDANVRAGALDLLTKVKGIEKRPEFVAQMKQLRTDPNLRLQLVAAGVLSGKTLEEALKEVAPKAVVDYDYFVAKIEPILATPGADGKACVMCHASHVIFRLRPPNEKGEFSEDESRSNFQFALRVIDVSNPQHSLILIKPTHLPEGGNAADYYATHNGGQRWPGNESSWQYKTILSWIRGARLETVGAR